MVEDWQYFLDDAIQLSSLVMPSQGELKLNGHGLASEVDASLVSM